MPAVFKKALLKPILNKSSFNREILKNFRPISNLAYVSKLIEKVADIQLSRYIEENNLDESMQSAYKAHHSTETAWVRLYNAILLALDDNLAVLLVCLHLSAAFDTIDYTILLHSRGDGQCLDITSEPIEMVAPQFFAEKYCDIAAASHIICSCYSRLSRSSIGDHQQLIIRLWEGNRTRSRECLFSGAMASYS